MAEPGVTPTGPHTHWLVLQSSHTWDSSTFSKEKVTLLDNSDPVNLVYKPNPENPGHRRQLQEVALRDTLVGLGVLCDSQKTRNQSLPVWASV